MDEAWWMHATSLCGHWSLPTSPSRCFHVVFTLFSRGFHVAASLRDADNGMIDFESPVCHCIKNASLGETRQRVWDALSKRDGVGLLACVA
jgi:hypothetical protein